VSESLTLECERLDSIYAILAVSEHELSPGNQDLLVGLGLSVSNEEAEDELRKID